MRFIGRSREVGLLFDIDELGTRYGREAYRFVFENLDPRSLTMCQFYDGDTERTLHGQANLYCIAIRTAKPRQVDYLRQALTGRADGGLRGVVEGRITEHEPLVLAGGVSRYADLVIWEEDMVQAAWAEGTEWGRNVIVLRRP